MYRKSLEYDGMCFFLGFTPEGHFPQSGVASYSSTFYLKNEKKAKISQFGPHNLGIRLFLVSDSSLEYVRALECDRVPVCAANSGVRW